MDKTKELQEIEEIYGENFAHLCEELFPAILEKEGTLLNILTSSFSNNCANFLYEDIKNNKLEKNFSNYIHGQLDKKEIETVKTPYELLSDAGYDLYECKNEDEIQEFRKYYTRAEELETFQDKRLNNCVVFFAVKKEVENIKRENFNKPKREDEYGTSVMSIQFSKWGLTTVSIENRYNYTVKNPSFTYGNDLDKITPGLTKSFATLLEDRGMKLNNSNLETLQIPGYIIANDGKFYKYNIKAKYNYYCPGNIIIDGGEAKELENSKSQTLIDEFVLDTASKTIYPYNKKEQDSFLDNLQDIEEVEINENTENQTKDIQIKTKSNSKPVTIQIDNTNQIVSYKNENLTEVGENFLFFNQGIKQLTLPNLKQAGKNFLFHNEDLETLSLPKLEEVDEHYLSSNRKLREADFSNLKKVGQFFLSDNTDLEVLNAPKIKEIGPWFLLNNPKMLTQIKEKSNSKSFINSKALSFLDKNSKLTESEVGLAGKAISKIKNMMKEFSTGKE